MNHPEIPMPEVFEPVCKAYDHWMDMILYGYCAACRHMLSPLEQEPDLTDKEIEEQEINSHTHA